MNALSAFRLRAPVWRFGLCLVATGVALLAGCGTGPSSPAMTATAAPPQVQTVLRTTPTPSPTVTPTASATPDLPEALRVDFAALDGVQVTLWEPFVGDMGALLSQLAAQFNRENAWGIQAKVVMLGSDRELADQLEQAAETDSPQLVLAPPVQLAAWRADGRLVVLDPYLASTLTRLEDPAEGAYEAVFWQQDQLDGQQVGIPALRTAVGLFYNRTWAQELGFETAPATPDEFRAQACEAAKVNNRSVYLEQRGTGGWLVDTSAETMLSWLHAFGAEGVPVREGEAYHFDGDAGHSALAFLRKMQEDGCLWVGKDPTASTYFSDRDALFVSGSLQDLMGQARVMAGAENQDEWTFLAYPATDGQAFVYADGYSFGLLRSDAAQQMAAWLFIRWLSQADHQAHLGAQFPSLPVSQTAADQLAQAPGDFPDPLILGVEKATMVAAPSLPSWMVARRPLEDAGWQLFHLASADQLDDLLPEVDALIAELLTH